MQLPSDFLDEMRTVIGNDLDEYIKSFERPAYRGISVNRLKTTPDRLLPLLGFAASPTPFYSDGFYIPDDVSGIGNSPLHHAGGFYVQEPSATSAVPLLEIEKGDFVLDICAAPGGKSAQIASLLRNTGLIWSNEPIRSRAVVLLSNHERMGISRGIVSSKYPDELCPQLAGVFDKVLVDAPCSGEGMFRKNPDAVSEWSRSHVKSCAERQLSILISAAEALRPGGVMVYSTCTFSHEENEMTVKRLLEKCPELEPFDIDEGFGRKTELSNAVRITPLEGGEGHFAARFRKKGDYPRTFSWRSARKKLSKEQEKQVSDFLDSIFIKRPDMAVDVVNNSVYLSPEELPDVSGRGLAILRSGVLVGEIVKNRIEPAHSLFVTADPTQLRRVLDLKLGDPRIEQFLSGMEIDCDGESSYTAVAVEGMICGFGKCSGGRLKNKYPKGLRRKKSSRRLPIS